MQTQCGYKLAEHINASEIGINEELLSSADKEQIILELEQLQTWDVDGEGKLKLNRKRKSSRKLDVLQTGEMCFNALLV